MTDHWPLLEESFRWYGPRDRVRLSDIRQTGATGVYTALHHIPYGEAWPIEDIARRKREIEESGLRWTAVEAVSVSEAIKSGGPERDRHLENYCETVKRLGAAGVDVVLNCFMPVFEWVRTDFARPLPDGKTCLAYDPVHFAAFDLYMLKRPNAASDYSESICARAERWIASLTSEARAAFRKRICGMLPGFDPAFTEKEVLERIAGYQDLGSSGLRRHLRTFLETVVPVAEKAGVRLAMHPDDPPFPIFGLPRILSTEADFVELLRMVDHPANGIALCTGSLGARPDNDIPGFVRRLGDRIHAAHLRNVTRDASGAFYESDHLGGSADLIATVNALLEENLRRRKSGRADWRLSFRPDHGHVMLDDLAKEEIPNPGYTLLGRLRGLAELRGVQEALAYIIAGRGEGADSTTCSKAVVSPRD